MTAMPRPAHQPSHSTRLLLTALAGAAIVFGAFAPATGPVHAATPAGVLPTQVDARQANQKDKRPMLTDEDIELIKVYEVKFADERGNPPKVRIPKRILKEMLEKYREDDAVPRGRREQSDFINKADGHEQLKLMFKLRAREYYSEVRISSPVASLRNWNQLHKSYVLSYFGKHFGKDAVPGFELLPIGREDKRIAMTNFYILTQTEIGGIPMIDRNNPEESLLLQWGLPREESKFAAPDVERWEPYYKDTDDERFIAAVDWIKSLIKDNQGQTYGIEYSLKKDKKQ